MTRLLAALSACLLVVPSTGSATSTEVAGPCAAVERTPFGPVGCRTQGGWFIEAGGRWGFTHGGDPALPSTRTGAAGRAAPNKPRCAGDPRREFHVQVIYAHAFDMPDRYNVAREEVEYLVKKANGVVVEEAAAFNRKVEIRTSCKKGEVWIRNVTLPTPFAETHVGTVFSDLLDQGYDSPLAKYWIWFDGHPPNVREAGIAQAPIAPTPNSPSNPANIGGYKAITWGGTGSGGVNTMLHELAHTMGAVSRTAPNTSGGGHCVDGPDVMCYPDGGYRAELYRGNVCSESHFDCNNDDYFHPKPGRKNYLSSNWNLASPMNRFIEGCRYKTNVLTVSGAGIDPELHTRDTQAKTTLIARQHAIPKKCRGRLFSVSAVIDPPDAVVEQIPPGLRSLTFQLMPSPLRDADVDVCWYDGAELLRCNAGGRSEGGKVPKAATHARVLLAAGAPAIYVLNIV